MRAVDSYYKKEYLHKIVHVIINKEKNIFDRWGVVTKVKNGILYGTWGDLGVNPQVDYINVSD